MEGEESEYSRRGEGKILWTNMWRIVTKNSSENYKKQLGSDTM